MTQDFAKLHEASQFAVSCREPAFKLFLHEKRGMEKYPVSDDKAVIFACGLLGIKVPSEFTDSPQARHRWQLLRSAFDIWRVS